MKLKEVRQSGIGYCEAMECSYTYISFDDVNEFYLTEKADRHTVFLLNRNGSLSSYHATSYAKEFHRELKRRREYREKNDKRAIADMHNRDNKEQKNYKNFKKPIDK